MAKMLLARTALRTTLLLGASLAALATPAVAQEMFVRRSVDPAAQAARAAQARGENLANAAAVAQQSLRSFARAAQARSQAQAVQQQARAAAAVAQARVPNGLVAGGLKPADGAVFDPGAIAAGNSQLGSPRLWTGARAPVQNTGGDGTVNVRIEQTQQKAILSWETFNVGAETVVHFDQRAGNSASNPEGARDWVALNRVHDPNARPTQILGKLKAEGQVYVLNRNGVIFGGASEVSVGGVVASALALRDEDFLRGIADPSAVTRFGDYPEDVTICAGETCTLEEFYRRAYDGVPTPGDVTVAAGARLTTSANGLAMLLGANVTNGGTITTPRGQTILAAGETVYISEPSPFEPSQPGQAPRGLQVMVSARPPQALEPLLRPATDASNYYQSWEERSRQVGMVVRNRGIVTADEGNITANGRNVFQDGVMSALTTIELNGSINLSAAHSISETNFSFSDQPMVFSGLVRLGERSLTETDVDYTDLRGSPDASPFAPGLVSLDASLIHLDRDSTLIARGGTARLVARSTVLDGTGRVLLNSGGTDGNLGQFRTDGSRIYMESGSLIDVSGSVNVPVAMERNSLEVELRGIELADSPLLRDGFLRGETINVDLREGTEIANIDDYAALIERSAAEKTITGGDVDIYSRGEFIMRESAEIDLSGGSLAYLDGIVTTTQLIGVDGRLVDIGDASREQLYAGFGNFTRVSPRWGVTQEFGGYLGTFARRVLERGYIEGADAGTLRLNAPFPVVEGRWRGGVSVGPRQRFDQPTGASLIVGAPNGPEAYYNWGPVEIVKNLPLLSADFTVDSALPADRVLRVEVVVDESGAIIDDGEPVGQVYLSEQLLEDARFSGWDVTNFGEARGVTATTLAADVDLTLTPGAQFEAQNVLGTLRAAGGTIATRELGAGAIIDVSGHWVNDGIDGGAGAVVTDGGSVAIGFFSQNDNQLATGVIGTGATIDVSGGGFRAADGTVTSGDAGSIRFVAGEGSSINGVLRGFAAGRGGTLGIETIGNVTIGGTTNLVGADLSFGSDFFGEGGFSAFEISSLGDLTIERGTTINLSRKSLLLDGDIPAYADGSAAQSFTGIGTAVNPRDVAVDLSLSAGPVNGAPALLTVGADVAIVGGVGSDIALRSSGLLELLGSVSSGGGEIGVSGRTIWLGAGSSLVSRGAPAIVESRGLREGEVLDGGRVSLTTAPGGFLVANAGALIDVSGAAAVLDLPTGSLRPGAAYRPTIVHSRGGSIAITATGGYMDATLVGRSGGGAAAGGELSISLGIDPTLPEPAQVLINRVLDEVRFDNLNFTETTLRQLLGEDINNRLVFGYDGPVIFTEAFFDSLLGKTDIGVSAGTVPEGLAPDMPPIPPGFDPFLADVAQNGLFVTLPGPALPAGISTGKFANGGFASVELSAATANMTGPVRIAADRSVQLSADLITGGIGTDAVLSAPIVNLASPVRAQLAAEIEAVEGQVGRFRIEADRLVDLNGASFAGIADIQIVTPGDVRIGGAVRAPGVLRFEAGQVYPSYNRFLTPVTDPETGVAGAVSEARIEAGQRIEIAQALDASGAPIRPEAPWTVLNRLTLKAPEIVQGGTVRAPFGELIFDAGERLNLLPESLTSVSGEGILTRFGFLRDGIWEVGFPETAEGLFARLATLPNKAVELRGPEIVVSEGATLDTSGGGDLQAFEWVPGPGGSRDYLNNRVLAQDPSAPPAFAIVPGYTAGFAPVDPAETGGGTVFGANAKVGDAVWISGIPGLPEGTYTLLPATYALLPGAFSIRAVQGSLDFTPRQNSRLADGSYLVSGRSADTVSGALGSRASAYRVTPGNVVRRYSEYIEATANTFFPSDDYLDQLERDGLRAPGDPLPLTANDAGNLIVAASRRLSLLGTIAADGAGEGRRGSTDISAARIAVIGARDDRAGLEQQGYLVLDAETLSGFSFGSLLLGGERRQTLAGAEVTQTASEVLITNEAATPLTGSEIILVGTDQIILDEGSAVAATGGLVSGTDRLLLLPAVPAVIDPGFDPTPVDDVVLEPARDDGALVRVSTGTAASIVRDVDAIQGAAGLIDIRSGASLTSEGALTLESTLDTRVAEEARLSARAIDLAASRISLGDAPAEAGDLPGIVLGSDALAAFSDTEQLTLRSRSAIDLYGDFVIGGERSEGSYTLAGLTLDAGAVVGRDGGDQRIAIAAGTLRFINTFGSAGEGGATANGVLAIRANEVAVGEGASRIAGFGAMTVDAGRFFGSGEGSLDVAGDLTIAGLIAGESGADTSIRADGRIVTTGGRGEGAVFDGLGAQLALSGTEIEHRGRIDLVGGSLTLTAREGDLVVADGARITAGGGEAAFFDVARGIPAGSVTLVSSLGDVRLREGSTIDLAGSRSGSDAGTLAIVAANGEAFLEGALLGSAVNGFVGGSFEIDTADIGDFARLNAGLNAGGFTGNRSYRVRRGDVAITGTTQVRSLTLTADSGAIDVSGTIDVGGADAGAITLHADGDVRLLDGARLLGAASGDEDGGTVLLATTNGVISADQGSLIDVSGGGAGAGGLVQLRAARTATGDVAVASLAGTIDARLTRIEAVRRYDGVAAIDAAVIDATLADAEAFMNGADAIKARLGRADDPAFEVVPGIELVSEGDMTLGAEWNLVDARYGDTATPGVLTFRAGGNLLVNASLSDGFADGSRDAAVAEGRSWSYRLVGGADSNSPNPLAIGPAPDFDAGGAREGSGNLILAGDTRIRTGTGSISIATGSDLQLTDEFSTIYTAGRPGESLPAFNAPTKVAYFKYTFLNEPPYIIQTPVRTALRADFNRDGGDLTLDVQGDFVGTPFTKLDWLWRVGRTESSDVPYDLDTSNRFVDGQNTAWWTHIPSFQGIGVLGGGDVAVTVGGDALNMSVSSPSHGRLPGAVANLANLVTGGGGNMTVVAGGDIDSGYFFIGKGTGSVVAGGSFGAARTRTYNASGGQVPSAELPLNTIVALQDGDVALRAGGDIVIGAVYNPTLGAGYSIGNGGFENPDDPFLNPIDSFSQNVNTSAFSTYTERSGIDMFTVGGDIVLANSTALLGNAVSDFALESPSFFDYLGDPYGLSFYPGRVTAAAAAGNIDVQGFMSLAGSRTGDLQLLARDNLSFGDANVGPVGSGARGDVFAMSDYDPLLFANPARPFASLDTFTGVNAIYRGEAPVHGGNDRPVRLYAVEGSVQEVTGNMFNTMTLARQARIEAGLDIVELSFAGQNNRPTDLTLLRAGRDILFRAQSPFGESGTAYVVGGPGRLDVQAGRNLVIPRGAGGIRTIGNNENLTLPDAGAAIAVSVGVPRDLDLAGFIARYLDPAGLSEMPDYLVRTGDGGTEPLYFPVLKRRVEALTGRSELSNDEAWAAFERLSFDDRYAVVREVFSYELRAGGREAVDPTQAAALEGEEGRGYARSYAAIATLFPGAEAEDGGGARDAEWYGNLIMDDSQIRTVRGGAIDILAPGGYVQVANRQAQPLPGSDDPRQGVITQRGQIPGTGEVRIFAFNDVEINRSRVLTVLGGDITMWSSFGDIDAGRGAKTALSVPPKRVTISPDAFFLVEDIPDTSGSGIGALTPLTGTRVSDVDLYAPGGVIDAGDAGIRVSGNLFLGALQVLNADNIDVGGEAFGLPPAVVANVNALTAASSATAAAIEEAASLAERTAPPTGIREVPSIITGRVLGFGEE